MIPVGISRFGTDYVMSTLSHTKIEGLILSHIILYSNKTYVNYNIFQHDYHVRGRKESVYGGKEVFFLCLFCTYHTNLKNIMDLHKKN